MQVGPITWYSRCNSGTNSAKDVYTNDGNAAYLKEAPAILRTPERNLEPGRELQNTAMGEKLKHLVKCTGAHMGTQDLLNQYSISVSPPCVHVPEVLCKRMDGRVQFPNRCGTVLITAVFRVLHLQPGRSNTCCA